MTHKRNFIPRIVPGRGDLGLLKAISKKDGNIVICLFG